MNRSIALSNTNIFSEENLSKNINANNTLKNIKITGLFHRINIDIKFTTNVMIMTGINGAGKTVVINILKSIIENNAKSLLQYEFESINLTRKINGKTTYDYIKYETLVTKQAKDMSVPDLDKTLRKQIEATISNYDGNPSIQIELKGSLKPNNHVKILKQGFDQNLIYLPTFRMIEKDLLAEDEVDENISQFMKKHVKPLVFSMKHTEKKINEICKRLLDSTALSFKTFSGNLLKEMLNRDENKEKDKDIIDKLKKAYNTGVLNIILTRLADGKDNDIPFSHRDKDHLLALVQEEEPNVQLNLILYKLVKEYEKQQLDIDKLKLFFNLSNKYLTKKSFTYDESLSKWQLVFNDANSFCDETPVIPYDETQNAIKLNNLSSGEQQIIFLFSEIFFCDNDHNNILLFDEPELSLSIEWQRSLISDIITYHNYDLLLVATHSPSIAIKELDEYTVDLESCTEDYHA